MGKINLEKNPHLGRPATAAENCLHKIQTSFQRGHSARCYVLIVLQLVLQLFIYLTVVFLIGIVIVVTLLFIVFHFSFLQVFSCILFAVEKQKLACS